MRSLKKTFKNWRAYIDSNEYFLVSKHLNTNFSFKYRITNSGMLVNVNFNNKYFVRHPKPMQEGKDIMLILERGIIIINNSPLKDPTIMSVIEKMIDG